MPRSKKTGSELWAKLVTSERRYFGASMALFRARAALLESDADVLGIIQQALRTVTDRGTALRLLLHLDEPIRRQVFLQLVEVASVGHADIKLVRDVIMSLDHQWLVEHLPPEIERILKDRATDEEYRRFAELLEMLHSPYLAALVENAAASESAEIREVAGDFRSRL